jgi:hypothetical protein
MSSTFLAAQTPPTPLVSHSILACLEDCPEAFYDLSVVTDIVKKVQSSVSSDNGSIGRPSRPIGRHLSRGEEETSEKKRRIKEIMLDLRFR